jgi:hypothetical protein
VEPYAEASTPGASLAVSSLELSLSASSDSPEVGGNHLCMESAENQSTAGASAMIGPWGSHEKLGWSRLMAEDGDGAILREIMSFFVVLDNDPLEAAAKDSLSRRDILAASATCHLISRATDAIFKMLLLPLDAVTCNPSGIEPAPTSLIKTRPNLAIFMSRPERRLRSHTASDTRGRQILDTLYKNPVFCVRYRGIRQGNILHASSGPERTRAAAIATGVWPLQLHTYFKMRTYTRFERLMGVYANRSHLPLPWLTFEVTDKLYGMPVDPRTGVTLAPASLPAANSKTLTTNNGRLPLIPYGHGISSSHSLWTVGVEPGDGGINAAHSNEAETQQQQEDGPGTAAPAAPPSPTPPAEHAAGGDGGGGDQAGDNNDATGANQNQHAAAAPAQQGVDNGDADDAVNEAAGAVEEEEEEEEEEEDDAAPSSLQDVWVDSYLTCAADECFVCVRDKRSNRDLSAVSERWRILDPNDDLRTAYGYFGGDSNLPFITNESDPGQPVRPPHAGWLFRVKANEPLEPIFRCIQRDLVGGTLAEGIFPVTSAAIHQATVGNSLAAMNEDAAGSLISSEPPQGAWEAAAAQVEVRSTEDASTLPEEDFTAQASPSGAGIQEPLGPSVSGMLFHFIAVAPQFSEYLATAYPTDTPSCASARAAALPSDVRLRQRLQPMHIFEVHDLESYVELVWSGCRIRRA